MNRLLLYIRTVRWLKPGQVIARIWFRLYRPRPDQRPAPLARSASRPGWAGCARLPSITAPDRLSFLGVERTISTAGDWNRGDWPKLWLYNAHYFDDLNAVDPSSRQLWHRHLLARWMEENPPGVGNGWEPYPVSLRIVNWIKWALAGNALDQRFLDSLAIQARWLERRLEFHLLGNHLWANAKALVFAGMFFRGDEAARWLRRGLRLIEREMSEQILDDGGHFERSAMYHSILLEDLLDLVQLSRRFPEGIPAETAQRWSHVAERMLRWASTMSHPDGEPPFFNDAALGIAPTLPQLSAYAHSMDVQVPGGPEEGITVLATSGYARMQMRAAVLLVDAAPVGPDYLPGHAHADTLSFELSLKGRRVLVNGGTSTYEAGPERQRQRGTMSHNTVVVDGHDSSEVWGAFRVARRARVFDVESGSKQGCLVLSAAHDGYRRLPGRVVHRRHWALGKNELVLNDRLEGKFAVAEARYRFAPGERVDWEVDGGDARIETTTWHPRFGTSENIEVLVVRFAGPACQTRFFWP